MKSDGSSCAKNERKTESSSNPVLLLYLCTSERRIEVKIQSEHVTSWLSFERQQASYLNQTVRGQFDKLTSNLY